MAAAGLMITAAWLQRQLLRAWQAHTVAHAAFLTWIELSCDMHVLGMVSIQERHADQLCSTCISPFWPFHTRGQLQAADSTWESTLGFKQIPAHRERFWLANSQVLWRSGRYVVVCKRTMQAAPPLGATHARPQFSASFE
jgi:hypothetical protein